MNCFLLNIVDMCDIDDIKELLDSTPEIKNWYVISRDIILVVSDSDLFNFRKTIQDLLHSKYNNLSFMIAIISQDTIDGWMPEKVWNFINTPTDSGYWTKREL
mgnify:CR=1 FL=1